MSEGLIGLRHSMRVFPLLHTLTALVGGVELRVAGAAVDGVDLPYAEDVTSGDRVVSVMVKHAAAVFRHRLKTRAMGACTPRDRIKGGAGATLLSLVSTNSSTQQT